MSATVAQGPCALHRVHAPRNQTTEWHHVIPVAWQLFAGASPQPGFVPPFPGPDTDGRGYLWDERGIWLCPTGHRNVHFWIVHLMRAVAAQAAEDAPAVIAACKASVRRDVQFEWATQALIRYLAEAPSRSLKELAAKGEFGQI